MSARKKILIIGGGFTGLTAALRLSTNPDFAITIVESSDRLGGLAGGFPIGGTSLEKTYHHLFLTDTTILDLVKELGLQDKLIWCNSPMGIYRGGKIYPFKTPGDLLRFSPCNFMGRLRTGMTALYLKYRKDWRGVAGKSAYQWMRRACGSSAMETIWTPLLKGKFDRHYQDISMAWFWARIHARANTRSGDGVEKLGYFRGGFNVVTAKLEEILRQRGVEIQTSSQVEKITTDRTAVVNGQNVVFDACVFTGSSTAFARLLPAQDSLNEYAAQLRCIEYLGAVCLVFTSSQSLGDFYWVNISEPGAPFLVFIQHTRLIGPENYGGENIYYIGAYLAPNGKMYSLPDAELARLWLDYVKKMFPDFDESRVGERHMFRFAAAQHIVDTTYEAKIPDYQTPLPGVFLANFSQVFPEDRGTNFAVREGEKIAELVSQSFSPASSR